MSNLTALNLMKKKIDVAGLTRDMFKDKKAVLEVYFRFNGKDITRFHIPKLDKVEYETEVKAYKGNISDSNKKFEDATPYFKKKMAMERVGRILGVPTKKLDFSSYLWDDDYFVYDDLMLSAMYVDNKFMEEPEEKPTSRELYITMDSHQSAFPKELYDELYSFCVETIKQRKAMLYSKVEQCVSVLKMLAESTNGFSMNTSANMVSTLRSYKKHFEELLTNEEFIQFVSNNSDLNIYCIDRNGCRDYIETYASMIKTLTGLNGDFRFKNCRDFVLNLIHNENDIYEKYIINRVFRKECKTIPYVEDLSEED